MGAGLPRWRASKKDVPSLYISLGAAAFTEIGLIVRLMAGDRRASGLDGLLVILGLLLIALCLATIRGAVRRENA